MKTSISSVTASHIKDLSWLMEFPGLQKALTDLITKKSFRPELTGSHRIPEPTWLRAVRELTNGRRSSWFGVDEEVDLTRTSGHGESWSRFPVCRTLTRGKSFGNYEQWMFDHSEEPLGIRVSTWSSASPTSTANECKR